MNDFATPHANMDVKCGEKGFELRIDLVEHPQSKAQDIYVKGSPNCELFSNQTTSNILSVHMPFYSKNCGIEISVKFLSKYYL